MTIARAEANVNKIRGKHNLKMGIDTRRLEYLTTILGNAFQISSNSVPTRQVWDNAASEVNSGDSFASFLLGAPSSGAADFNVRPFYSSRYLAPYLQDDWKISHKLTLNLGLRYDFNTPPSEKYNRLVRGFDLNAASPIAGAFSAESLALYPNLRNLTGGLQFAGVGGNGARASSTYTRTIQPRVGAAYQLSDRLVLRGGYGMFFANWPNGDFYSKPGLQHHDAFGRQRGRRTYAYPRPAL